MTIRFVRKSLPVVWTAIAAAALILAACQPAGSGQTPTTATSIPVTGPTSGPTSVSEAAPSTAIPASGTVPSVTVNDQAIKDNSVVIAKVVSQGPGFLVIHADDNGKPGPVILGYAAVKDGENTDVIVNIGAGEPTSIVHAMLHIDAGKVDEYEFPGPDVPAMLNGEMVSPPFKVTGGTASADGPTTLPTEVTPAAQLIVDVADQPIQDGTVTMNDVVSIGPGWLVIHIDDHGNPGEVIGFAPVRPGHNPNLAVKIDPAKATPILFAMLHVDAGTVGTYEFPGPDMPAMENGQMVSPSFQANPGAGGQPAATVPAEPTPSQVKVLVVDHPQLGKILVDEKGLTLYLFTKDPPGQTVCTGGCAENWPPLLTTSGVPVAGEGLPGKLDVIARPDNGIQVTYKDIPLYYFEGDDKPGDVNGQGLGNVWFVLNP